MSAKRNRDKSDRATTKEAAVSNALDQIEERVRSLHSALYPEANSAAEGHSARGRAENASVDPGQLTNATERADALSAELDAIENELALRGRMSSGRVGRLLLIVGLLVLLVAPFYAGLWLAVEDLTAEDTRARLFWALCREETATEKRAQTFLELAALGHTEWRSARLQGLKLAGVDLSGRGLHGADLKRSELTNAVLSGADLGYGDLTAANLAGSKFISTNLREVFLNEASVGKADFTRAELSGAYMQRIRAAGARFNDAVLTRARLNDAQLVDGDFGGARLDEANLERADLTRSNLKGANLSAASLSGTVLTDANWWRAVGLTPETIERLVTEFPPSQNAAAGRIEDYKRWQSDKSAGTGR